MSESDPDPKPVDAPAEEDEDGSWKQTSDGMLGVYDPDKPYG